MRGSVILDVDDPNSTEDKQLNSQEYIRSRYPFDGLPFNYHMADIVSGGFVDMMPTVKSTGTMPYGSIDGIASIDEVNIPLAADSRVRLAVVIPGSLLYNSSTGAQDTHMSFGTQ